MFSRQSSLHTASSTNHKAAGSIKPRKKRHHPASWLIQQRPASTAFSRPSPDHVLSRAWPGGGCASTAAMPHHLHPMPQHLLINLRTAAMHTGHNRCTRAAPLLPTQHMCCAACLSTLIHGAAARAALPALSLECLPVALLPAVGVHAQEQQPDQRRGEQRGGDGHEHQHGEQPRAQDAQRQSNVERDDLHQAARVHQQTHGGGEAPGAASKQPRHQGAGHKLGHGGDEDDGECDAPVACRVEGADVGAYAA
mmetsp:Transcript_5550/g.13808  ORF Transcript_5550/g.13808 Transcript_5550/m.13808 type:complete len:252 (+) Transcript_5550:140-895(+)